MQEFSGAVNSWYERGHRDLPWRRTDDPYRIWVSEIMLQQTRAETVVDYYERFLARFPDVQALAEAPEQDLLKAWEGLGYYSRARNLQKAARVIVNEFGGKLPASVEGLRGLPGIGDYTAGAVASIAFGIPAPAVDGNFERVLCRYDGMEEPVGTPASRKRLQKRGEELVSREDPRTFANAMMELGATVCTPRSPSCDACPLAGQCGAHRAGNPEHYPVKLPKKVQRTEEKDILLVFDGKTVLAGRRSERLLGGLYAFPDRTGWGSPQEICETLRKDGIEAAYEGCIGEARHVFTHIIWEMKIHALVLTAGIPQDSPWQAVDSAGLMELPMPTAIRTARRLAAERIG